MWVSGSVTLYFLICPVEALSAGWNPPCLRRSSLLLSQLLSGPHVIWMLVSSAESGCSRAPGIPPVPRHLVNLQCFCAGLGIRACGKHISACRGRSSPPWLTLMIPLLSGWGEGARPRRVVWLFPRGKIFWKCPQNVYLWSKVTGLPGAISQWNPLSSSGHDIYLHWVTLGPTGTITFVIIHIYLHIFVEPGVSMEELVLGWRSLWLRNKSWDRDSTRTAQVEEEDYTERGLRDRERDNWVGRGQNGTFLSLSASALLGTSFEPQTQVWLKQTVCL